MNALPKACGKCDRPFGINDNADDWRRRPIVVSGKSDASIDICPDCSSPTETGQKRSSEASATDDQLRLFIERVERLEEEKRAIADDIRDVYAEAKAQGYDAKIMRQIVKLRRMEPHHRQEAEAILDLYKASLGLH